MNFWQQLDAIIEEHRQSQIIATQRSFKLRGNAAISRSDLSVTEILLIEKLQRCVKFAPFCAHKRFVRQLSASSKLSDLGRAYLAFIAHRYRRQWAASDEEFEWILRWKKY